MQLVIRKIEPGIEKLIGKNKVILIMGTRRVGKTVLISQVREKYQGIWQVLNAEDFDVQQILSN